MRPTLALAAALVLALQPANGSAFEHPDPGKAQFLSGNEVKALILEDFVRFDPRYVEHREQFGGRLDKLGRRLADIQAAGKDMECRKENYPEAKRLHRYTAEWDHLKTRLDDLERSLDKLDQEFAIHQLPETGLWGVCYEQPFFKIEATPLALIQLANMGE